MKAACADMALASHVRAEATSGVALAAAAAVAEKCLVSAARPASNDADGAPTEAVTA